MSEEQDRKRALRTRGYDDALAGRSRISFDPDYLSSFRRGQERRAALLSKTGHTPATTTEGRA